MKYKNRLEFQIKNLLDIRVNKNDQIFSFLLSQQTEDNVRNNRIKTKLGFFDE